MHARTNRQVRFKSRPAGIPDAENLEIVIRVVLRWLSRNLSSWQMLIGSLLASGLAMALIPAVTGVAALTLLAAWIGMGLGLTGPISQALLHDISPPERIGELLGLRVTLLNASHAGVPMLFRGHRCGDRRRAGVLGGRGMPVCGELDDA